MKPKPHEEMKIGNSKAIPAKGIWQKREKTWISPPKSEAGMQTT
jgi:hypothetical protein